MQNVMWKKWSKSDPQSSNKISFWSHFGLPKPSFFRDFGNKNEDDFLQHKNKQKRQQFHLPNPPPELKLNGLWPEVLVGGRRRWPSETRQWPLARRILEKSLQHAVKYTEQSEWNR